MKKKFTLSIIALFFTSFSFSQVSGEIEYRVKVANKSKVRLDSIKEVNPEKASLLEKGMYRNDKAVPFLSYHLIFNKNASIFERNAGMETDSGPSLQRAASSVGAIGKFYINLNEDLRLQKKHFLDTDWLIEKNISTIDWEIEDEKKVIANYTCQKANAMVNLNSKKRDAITAWFCPEISFQHGPMGYVGLPGMILELSIRHYVLYAKEISFSDKEKEIKEPHKGKRVSWEAYAEETDNRIQSIFERNRRKK